METKNYINTNPSGIEEDSMKIISRELSHLMIPEKIEHIIKRIVHTTADFEYAHLLETDPRAIEKGENALAQGCKIYADTTMITSGVSKPALKKLNCGIYSLVHDEKVVEKSRSMGITRSICGVNEAAEDAGFKIFVIGNAPTALVRICELYDAGHLNPDLIIGVPVGFVGAAESKEMLKKRNMPSVITRGRKGGSTVAVAILNAMLYDMLKKIS